ncbi:hypothetical protein BGZ58_009065 [Dissophora ornata]|nr:hypothetical protein BGZ58_009065 [Dissophora ornata]
MTYFALPEDTSLWSLLLLVLALFVFFYHAREYPRWRTERIVLQTRTEQPQQQPQTPSTASTAEPPLPASTWPHTFSPRWIPYLPFAVVYLLIKSAWTGLRFLILHSLLAAEHAGVFLIAAVEQGVEWAVNHGPDIIKTSVIAPLHAVALALWESPAVAAVASAIKNTLVPAVVRVALVCQEKALAAATSGIAWMKAAAEPARAAITWIVVECMYNPMQALWARLAILGITFVQTAKIYLHELAKDARDLGWLVAKAAIWIWTRTLKPLGEKLYTFGDMIVSSLAQILPWLALRIYTGILRPVGMAVLEGLKIVRSHPTVLAGMQALSCKVKELCLVALQRLESVNWLTLLETVLTKAVTFLYRYTMLTLQQVGRGIQVFAMDVIPNAYKDLLVALEIARPIVAWVVDKFVRGVYPLWQAVSWISWTVISNIQSTLVWLHEKGAVPAMELWKSKIQPGVSYVAAKIVSYTWTLTEAIVKTASMVAAVAAPVWDALLKMVDVVQAMLSLVETRIVHLSGGLGEYVKSLAPQFESFKAQTGRAMDELVDTMSNFMMDWVKKEKRD